MAETKKRRGKVYHKIVVDGSNVLHYPRSKSANVKNLQLLIRKLKAEGYEYRIFVDASARHRIDGEERPVFERMVAQGIIQQVPVHTPADRLILEYATEHPEYKILSNDAFQDWESEFKVVRDPSRFMRFMIVGGDVIIVKPGATLPHEKVDIRVTFVDGKEIVRLDGESELSDVRYWEDEEDVDEGIAQQIFSKFGELHEKDRLAGVIRKRAHTIGIKAFGRAVPKVKRGVELAIDQTSADDKISVKKTKPILGKSLFGTYPGIWIVIEERRQPSWAEKAYPRLTPEEKAIMIDAHKRGLEPDGEILGSHGMAFVTTRGSIWGSGKLGYYSKKIEIEPARNIHNKMSGWKGVIYYKKFDNNAAERKTMSSIFEKEKDAWRWIWNNINKGFRVPNKLELAIGSIGFIILLAWFSLFIVATVILGGLIVSPLPFLDQLFAVLAGSFGPVLTLSTSAFLFLGLGTWLFVDRYAAPAKRWKPPALLGLLMLALWIVALGAGSWSGNILLITGKLSLLGLGICLVGYFIERGWSYRKTWAESSAKNYEETQE